EYAIRKKNGRVILALPRRVAPIHAHVLPLVSKNGLPEKAQEVYRLLLRAGFEVEYDESGRIGRRYVRADEIGTPLCITIDYQTLEDNTVTLRDRDTWEQVRVPIDRLPNSIRRFIYEDVPLHSLGEPVKTIK
ncbi:glycine--tRNA ligase, partial [archaeon]|nr:glycine--tRNA ligase [archaeon]